MQDNIEEREKTSNFEIGDSAKEYIYTMLDECTGCIELTIAQNLDGDMIKVVSNTHGGVGFIQKGSTAKLKGTEHNDEKCTVPDDRKYKGVSDMCSGCWMNVEHNT